MPPRPAAERARDLVVLLHGLGRTRRSMRVAQRRVERAGYRAVSLGYPSRTQTIETIAGDLAAQLPDPGAGRLHFLAHSLGGIVVRVIARDHRPARLGRVVMLGPPNQGSVLAGRLRHWRVDRALMGPAGRQLVSDPDGIHATLGPVDFETGVIAGSWPLGLLPWLDGPNDGLVAVRETEVEGMTDHVVMRENHGLILLSRPVVREALHFFDHGRFGALSSSSSTSGSESGKSMRIGRRRRDSGSGLAGSVRSITRNPPAPAGTNA